ncbi:hypothetical protein CMP1-25 [Clavibacter phage CMP1]|uniref:Uncharacterized protein n=1 Tax=Clavibacter phage CMP1 TaxID=686439 RepID=D0U209_9CAUD|nr:hypothetical protein CMP1-25 [Clavibacter phage CMP1]ACY35921.1 hypothetical protein CMP1-25 [Clavibacter phage CMP1]
MSSNGIAESEAILSYMKKWAGGRVSEELNDDSVIVRDSLGMIRPYVIISFLEPFGMNSDRSLDGEGAQPMMMPWTATLWGPSAKNLRQLAGSIRNDVRGKKFTENMSEIEVVGGGSFAPKDADGVPSLYARTISCQNRINMSTDNPSVEASPSPAGM